MVNSRIPRPGNGRIALISKENEAVGGPASCIIIRYALEVVACWNMVSLIYILSIIVSGLLDAVVESGYWDRL